MNFKINLFVGKRHPNMLHMFSASLSLVQAKQTKSLQEPIQVDVIELDQWVLPIMRWIYPLSLQKHEKNEQMLNALISIMEKLRLLSRWSYIIYQYITFFNLYQGPALLQLSMDSRRTTKPPQRNEKVISKLFFCFKLLNNKVNEVV